MKFSLIICTLGERKKEFTRLIESLEHQTYDNFEVVVVTQGCHDEVLEILAASSLKYVHIVTDKRGLSRARNLGLEKTTGDYVTISDDDCWYPSDALEIVYRCFIGDYKEIGVLCFQIFDPLNRKFYKIYDKEILNLNIKNIGSRSSIEIFYRNDAINRRLRFDENFGLGAQYPSGEENIFLADLLKASNKLLYIPEVVVYHKVKDKVDIVFTSIKMKTVFHMFRKIFGCYKGTVIYYIYLIKHFSKIQKKLDSFLLQFKGA